MRNANYFFTIGLLVIAGVGAYIGYGFFNSEEALEKPNIQNFANVDSIIASDEGNEVTEAGEIKPVGDVVDLNTEMVYEYHYTKDNTVERSVENPPYFLQGLTRAELAERLSGWEITEFSRLRVVLSKEIAGEQPKYYIVGIQDGYIAVFQKTANTDSILKEKTDISIRLLPEEEIERLEAGIPVAGEDRLIKILEDYGS